MRMLRIPLRVVFYMEEERWIAHCLEFDLLGDGDTQEEALECLSESIRLQVGHSIEHNNPDNLFTPAEGKYQRMFCAGRPVTKGQIVVHHEGVQIEGVDAREFKEDGELAAC